MSPMVAVVSSADEAPITASTGRRGATAAVTEVTAIASAHNSRARRCSRSPLRSRLTL